MVEKLTALLKAYCEQQNEAGKFSVMVSEHEGMVRAVVVAEHFSRCTDRQWYVEKFLRDNLTAEEYARVGCIQTIAPDESPFQWKD